MNNRKILISQLIANFLLITVGIQHNLSQTTFHGNIARTGVYESSGPKRLNGVKWAFKTDGPIIASPAIAGGVVFIGSQLGSFYAIDQTTGQQKWKFDTRGAIVSSPAVSDGIVYFDSYDGGLYALDVNTGARKWRFAMEFEKRFSGKALHGYSPREQLIPDAWDFFMSSPAIFKGRVYFGSGDGNFYAVDAKTGILQWKFPTKDTVHASPAIANNTVYIGSWDSNFYALDAETGLEKWRFETGKDPIINNQVGFQASAALLDGTVYVGCRDAHIYALDAATGRKKWDYPTNKSWVSATPSVRGDTVFMSSADTSRFHALDAKTGHVKFTFDAKAMIFSSAALAGDLAYFGDLSGRLYAVDINSGKLIWEFQTENSKKDVFKMLGENGKFSDTAFIPTFRDFGDDYVYMYKRFSLGSILSSPVVDQGEIYFGSTDGFLYALK